MNYVYDQEFNLWAIKNAFENISIRIFKSYFKKN